MQEKKNIFSPLTIKGMEMRNRVVMPPMCQYSAKDGFVNDWHLRHYGERALGGVGLIIVESTSVAGKVGMITDNDLSLSEDSHMEGMKKVVDTCHKYGAKIAVQINHAGRKSQASVDSIYAPSPIAFSEDYRVPVEMTKEDIRKVQKAFVEGAQRAVKSGFDAIEFHGAHGYLISSFLSPLSNKRSDEYGQNRALFLQEILTETRKVLPANYPIILRVSARDWEKGGNEVNDMVELLRPLKSLFDFLDVSSGGVVSTAKIAAYPGYQVFMASWVKEALGVPCMGGGLVSDSRMANTIVKNGASDAVYIGRELLRNPYWVLKASKDLGVAIDYAPTPYLEALK